METATFFGADSVADLRFVRNVLHTRIITNLNRCEFAAPSFDTFMVIILLLD